MTLPARILLFVLFAVIGGVLGAGLGSAVSGALLGLAAAAFTLGGLRLAARKR